MLRILLVSLLILFTAVSGVFAAEAKPRILFVPHDDRPVSLQYTADTVKAAGLDIVLPPRELIGTREKAGNPDALWKWLCDELPTADAVVLSGDTLIYGGLVPSRKHHIADTVLTDRVQQLNRIKQINPNVKLYLFTSIMRSPKFSAGGVEPEYYDQYGPGIFRITAFQDKAEIAALSANEQKQLALEQALVPREVIADWLKRREQNLGVNLTLITLAHQGIFDFLVLGKDDNAPYSQTHRESRTLLKAAAGLSPARFQSLSGVDEIAMVLLTRAVNDITLQVPLVAVRYAPGRGPETIPAYADEEMGKSVLAHLFAAGAIPLYSPERADFTLLINTDEEGITREAGVPGNRKQATPAARALAAEAEQLIGRGIKVAVADVAFANGADNGFMHELKKRRLLSRLIAYSGWNTPNNSVGFAIGQGSLALGMNDVDRQRLLAVRLLDDWAYQANIRGQLVAEVLAPRQGSYFYLNELEPILKQTAQQKTERFAAENLDEFNFDSIHVDFPWNRMFELNIGVTIKN